MITIFRTSVEAGKIFKGPKLVTFGWQSARDNFSIWHPDDAPFDSDYIIIGTGHDLPRGGILVASCVLPDGFHVFHLVKLTP